MPLRDILSDSTKVTVRRAFSKLGIEIGAYSGSFAEHRATLLKTEQVSTVWDVGAHVGQFGARLLSNGYRRRIISVEPSPHSFIELSRRAAKHAGWTAVEFAVSDMTGPVTLNLSGNGQSSSLLAMSGLHASAFPSSRYVGRKVVQATTLDLLRPRLDATPPFYIKLDLQGGELAALRGASTTLAATNACEVELSLAPLYDGQSSWQEVIAFLASAGFAICDMERVVSDPMSGDLLQVNALVRRQR